MKCKHISFAKDFSDGGISTSVSSIISSQKFLGFESSWITTKNINIFQFNDYFKNNIGSIFHIHGLWRMPTAYLSINKINASFIISPHGMLSQWALKRSSLKKKIALKLWEARTIKQAKCLHALSNAEVKQIKNIDERIPVALIPNCIENNYTEYASLTKKEIREMCGFSKLGISPKDKILLYLGRFHKGKNLDLLIKVWSSIRKDVKKNSWKLVIIGDGFMKGKLEALNSIYPKSKNNWYLLPPRFNKEKFLSFYASDAFILCSDSEALPMSPLEAMSTGLFCLLSKECNLNDFIDNQLAFGIEKNEIKFKNSLLKLINQCSKERENLKKNIIDYLKRKYSKEVVGKKYIELYSWIYNKKNVKLDFMY